MESRPAPSLAESTDLVPDAVAPLEASEGRPCVFWLDLNGRVSRWSASAARLFAYDDEAVHGLPFRDLFTIEERDADKPDLLLARAREFGCWEETGGRLSGDGRCFRVASIVTLVRTPNGLEIGYHVATRVLAPYDDSAPAEGQSPEEVLRLLAMGRLASNVAHELNNLLAALRGFAHVIGRHLPEAGAPYEAWRQTLKACDRGTDLTRQLLGLSRPEDDGLQPVDVAAAVRGIEPLLRQVLPDRILLVTALASGLPRVLARSRDIDLALLNLVVNARDAIDAHGTIAIQALWDAGSGGAAPGVVLSVRDSGSGMSPEVQRRAFDRFFTTKSSDAGTGLGLSLVRDAVRSWGGSVDLASEVGGGTCVALRLLAAEPTELQGDLFTARSPRARVAICAPAPTRDLIAALLTRKGYAVFAVADQADLRKLLAGGSSEVDVFLAGGPAAAADGAGLVEVLGEMPARPPAVVFFAVEQGTITSPWAAYPSSRFLWGPVVPELLVEEIERALGGAHESRDQARIH